MVRRRATPRVSLTRLAPPFERTATWRTWFKPAGQARHQRIPPASWSPLRCTAAGIMARRLQDTGWRPMMTKIVAGALLYTQYGWLKRWLMKRIVAKARGDTDTRRDYEYTDWNDLRAFVEEFADRVRMSTAVAARPSTTQVA